MANVLGGLLAGFDAGRKSNAGRAKAAAERAEKDRNFAVKLAGESRLLQGAAEDAFDELEGMISSENWDPSMVPSLLAKAKRFDATYGSTWKGGSAESHFARRLHLAGSKPADEGKQGPDAPMSFNSPLAGFESKLQKESVEQKMRELRTKDALSAIQINALAAATAGAKRPDGTMDPDMVSANLTRHQAETIAAGDFDPSEILPLYTNLRAQLAEVYAGTELSPEEEMARRKELDQRVQDGNDLIDDIFKKSDGIGGMVFLEGSNEIRTQMKSYMAQAVAAGDLLGQIQLDLAQMFANEDGTWPTGAKVDPYHAMLQKAPQEFGVRVREFYDNPGYDLMGWTPAYDDVSNVGAMVNKDTGEIIPIYEPAVPLQYGPNPGGAAQPEPEPAPVETSMVEQPAAPAVAAKPAEPPKPANEIGSLSGPEFLTALRRASEGIGSQSGTEFMSRLQDEARRIRDGGNMVAGGK